MSFTKGRWEYDRAQAEVWNLDDVKIASLAETELVHQNGALIAAAPDLYEALKMAVHIIELFLRTQDGAFPNAVREEEMPLLKAAIAKAEGRQ